MGSLKTLAAVLLAASSAGSPAHADPDLPRLFATCAGQFSAAVAHSWLTQDPDRARLESDHATFRMLLEAMGLDTDPDTLNLRIDARAAQAALLQAASFGTDTTRALKAKRRANAQINTCRLLLLDG